MSPFTQTFLTTLQQAKTAPLVEAAEAFYTQLKDLSDPDALAHTRALIAHLLPIKAQLEGTDIAGVPVRRLTETAYLTLVETFSQEALGYGRPDGMPLSNDEADDRWAELVGILSASELLPKRAQARALGKIIHFQPTDTERLALEKLTAHPATPERICDFLLAIHVQNSDQLLRAARLIRDHQPRGDSPWYAPPNQSLMEKTGPRPSPAGCPTGTS